MMGRLSGLPIFILTNYNLAVSVPLTAIQNRESRGTRPPCESRAAPSSPLGETLRTKCGYSVRRRAVKTFKSAKGVWVGETNEVCLRNVRVFPHKQHIKSSRDYPPKQSGGLFRKHTTQLNYSLSTNKGSSTRCFLYSFYCSTHLSFRYRCSEYHPRSPAAFSAYPSRASEYACAPGSP